jgi:hypothetical protein
MPLNRRYIKKLSDMFVDDLRRSDYYRQLTESQRHDLEDRLTTEAAQGYYPLVPGAESQDLAKLAFALLEELNIRLPESLMGILSQVDGFVANGVTMYGVDGDLRDDAFDAVPGLVAENSIHWASFPETMDKYLFIGDADLWHFAMDLATGCPVVLHRGTLTEAHRFSSLEELVDDMMHQALGYFEDTVENPAIEPTNLSAGFHFSRS